MVIKKMTEARRAQGWTQTRNASERNRYRVRLLEMLLIGCYNSIEDRVKHVELLADVRDALCDGALSSRNRRFKMEHVGE